MITHVAFFGKRISLASQTSRRWFVALVYMGLMNWVFWPFFLAIRIFFLISCFVWMLSILLFVSVGGTGEEGGDEREEHRRDHAFHVAYRCMSWVLIPALFMSSMLGATSIPNLIDASLKTVIIEASYALLSAFITLYATLPQAILLWTEPDMEEG